MERPFPFTMTTFIRELKSMFFDDFDVARIENKGSRNQSVESDLGMGGPPTKLHENRLLTRAARIGDATVRERLA